MSTPNAPFFVDNEVIVLTRNGVWMADGIEITHEPTRRLFSRSLKRDAQGWFLSVDWETKRISVEDTAYFIHRVDGSPPTGFELWVSDGSREPLQPKSLHYRPGRLVCVLSQGTRQGEEAKFLHAAYFDLLQHLSEDVEGFYLTIQSQKIILASKP